MAKFNRSQTTFLGEKRAAAVRNEALDFIAKGDSCANLCIPPSNGFCVIHAASNSNDEVKQNHLFYNLFR